MDLHRLTVRQRCYKHSINFAWIAQCVIALLISTVAAQKCFFPFYLCTLRWSVALLSYRLFFSLVCVQVAVPVNHSWSRTQQNRAEKNWCWWLSLHSWFRSASEYWPTLQGAKHNALRVLGQHVARFSLISIIHIHTVLYQWSSLHWMSEWCLLHIGSKASPTSVTYTTNYPSNTWEKYSPGDQQFSVTNTIKVQICVSLIWMPHYPAGSTTSPARVCDCLPE